MPINTNINTSRISLSNSYNNNITSIKTSISNAYVPYNSNTRITPIETEEINLSKYLNKNNDAIIYYAEASHGILDSEKAQGMTKTDEYVYISAHDPDDDLGSRIYVYDRYNGDYLGFIRLADFNDKDDITNNSHVGGITYDKDHDILYVTQYDGEIVAYNNATITKYIKDNNNKIVKDKLIEYSKIGKISEILRDGLIDIDVTHLQEKIEKIYNNNINSDIYELIKEELSFIDIDKLKEKIKKDIPSYIEESRSEKNCLIDMRLIPNEDYESDFHIATKKVDGKYLLFKDKELDATEDGQNAATTYYHDGVLYSATYETNGKGTIKAYKVNYNKNVLNYELLFETEAPRQTQGIAVTEYNGKKYLLTSQSLGYNSSTITTSIINDDGTVEELGMHEFWDYMGMQGLFVDESNNKITCISEFQNKTKEIEMKQLTSDFVDKNDYKYMRHKLLQDIMGYFYKKEYKNDFNKIISDINELNKYGPSVIIEDLKENPGKTIKGISKEVVNTTQDYIDDVEKGIDYSAKYTYSKATDYINNPEDEFLNDLEVLYGKGVFIQTFSKDALYKLAETGYKLTKPVIKPVYKEIKKEINITKDFYEEASKHSAKDVIKDFGSEVGNTIEDYEDKLESGAKKVWNNTLGRWV